MRKQGWAIERTVEEDLGAALSGQGGAVCGLTRGCGLQGGALGGSSKLEDQEGKATAGSTCASAQAPSEAFSTEGR